MGEEFEVGSGKELRRKYYPPGESPPVIKIDATEVPAPLRSLIPLAEKWGISDDILREDAIATAPHDELTVLRGSVDAHRTAINEWLGGPAADNPPFSVAYLAFTHMKMAAD